VKVEGRRPPAGRWDERCSEILRRMAGRHHDRDISAAIAAETGKCFRPRTVAGYRRAGDLPPCRRNDWTAALKALSLRQRGDFDCRG
jgi:hypothetical protein